jgi:hypothetical protein
MKSSDKLRAYKNSNSPFVSLFWWSLIILSLTALAILSWTSSIYIFSNPQENLPYKILTKLGRLEPIKKFSKSSPPQSRIGYRSARELLESDFSNLSGVHLTYQNEQLLKNYIQNYKDENSIYYIKDDFIVTNTRQLNGSDKITKGLAIKAISKNFNRTEIIIILPSSDSTLEAKIIGEEISLQSNHFSSIVHVSVNTDEKTTFTAIPIVYGLFKIKDSIVFNLEPPEVLNVEGRWPIEFKK